MIIIKIWHFKWSTFLKRCDVWRLCRKTQKNSGEKKRETRPSFFHPVISVKPHSDMRPANRSVRVKLGSVWQWCPNPTGSCCFGRYASAEEILRPKRPKWSQQRMEIKSSSSPPSTAPLPKMQRHVQLLQRQNCQTRISMCSLCCGWGTLYIYTKWKA